MRTLVVTNDFPPRQGGIQTFVAALLARTDPASLVVLASRSPGWEAYDAALPYPVVRRPTSMLLPTRATARDAVALAREHGCDTAFFGAAAPLGLLAPALRAAGVRRLVGATHGHETGWVALPGSRQLMRRIAGGLDLLTYISEYTHARLAPALADRVASSAAARAVARDGSSMAVGRRTTGYGRAASYSSHPGDREASTTTESGGRRASNAATKVWMPPWRGGKSLVTTSVRVTDGPAVPTFLPWRPAAPPSGGNRRTTARPPAARGR